MDLTGGSQARRLAVILVLGLLGTFGLTALVAPTAAPIEQFLIAAGQGAARLELTLPHPSDQPEALLVAAHGGTLSAGLGRAAIPLRSAATQPLDRYRSNAIIRLPPDRGVGPEARIELSVSSDRVKAGLNEVYFGPATNLEAFDREFRERIRLVNLTMPAAVWLCLMMALALVFLAGTPARYAYLGAVFAIQLLIEFDGSLAVFGFHVREFEGYLGVALGFLLLMAISEWWQRPAFHRRIIATSAALACAALMVADAVYGLNALATAWLRLILFLVFISAAATYWFFQVRQSLRAGGDEVLVVTAWCSFALIAALTNMIRLYVPMPLAGLAFGLCFTKLLGAVSLTGLSLSALAHEYREYRRRTSLLDQLGRIVSGNNQTIDRQSRELREQIEQRIVLEERERMNRDLHDGLSGQLLSLLLQARSGKIDPGLVERELSRSLEDLRLIAAARTSSSGDCLDALDLFRLRIAQQLAAADMALDWSAAADLPRPSWSQSDLLNVMRVLQEAVTNAIRHAGARRVAVSLDPVGDGAGDGAGIAIAVTDDGAGFEVSSALDRPGGLRNMRHRAGHLGGSLTVAANPAGHGSVVTLRVPL